jgi:hypothetical protein
MALAIPFDAHLAKATEDYPQTVTISGTDYQCIADTLRRGEGLMMEGVMGEADLLVVMRVAVLAQPNIGSKLAYLGRQYRIERTQASPCGTAYTLECIDIAK